MNSIELLRELTLEEKASLCSGADFWRTKAIKRLGIPSVMMCDGPHGLRKQAGVGDHLGVNDSIEAVCFPTASALAASFDRALLYRLGEVLGEECQAEEIAILLGPGINMKRSPLCGRNFEYFSEDPYVAGQLATAYIKGLQSKGIAACVKHFAANNQETRRMSGNSIIDERTLHEIYLAAFETVVKEAAPRSVMCSYNQVNGTYASENKELLTDILRDKWGFDGFVVTDWGAVKDRVVGLRAGLDLEMPARPPFTSDTAIVQAVQNGTLAEAVLDKAVKNILDFLAESIEQCHSGYAFDVRSDHALTSDFAAECAVLLKNDRKVLPLAEGCKYAFIGEFAEKPRYQGSGSSHINVPHVVSAFEAVRNQGINYAQGYRINETAVDAALVQEAVKAAKNSDVAIIFAGLPNSFETEGVDRSSMDLPNNQNHLIEAVAAVQKNVVVVLHNGSPINMPWANQVPTILEMYLGGDSVGQATVDLLFGRKNPSGKIAETFPQKLSDNPSYLNFPGEEGIVEYKEGIFIGYRYYDKKEMDVLFPFGHGLSYTTFTYDNLRVSKDTLSDTETLCVVCTVRNTGSRAGKEVVQLYVRDDTSKIQRPIRELKEFAKVELQPGEEKDVEFTLDKKAFAYYEPRLNDWHVESGTFTLELGASSRDIRLAKQVEIISTTRIPRCYTPNSVLADVIEHPDGEKLIEELRYKGGFLAGDDANNEDTQKLGEGSEEMMRAMMMEMTIDAMARFGDIPAKAVSEMIDKLNK